ncbi:MAG: glucose-1-phosphate adenylyltransferase [Paraglaciecola sp.]
MILAGGKGSRLCKLTQYQFKPIIHFGGKFKVIDFPLSNFINLGIRQIGVMTQYKACSLIRHLSRGWEHLNRDLGEYVELFPASQQYSSSWHEGMADALYQNIEFIREHAPKYVVALPGDHIYKVDYVDMLVQHVKSGADMTVSCIEMSVREAAGVFGVMCVVQHNRITKFHENPLNLARSNINLNSHWHLLASMGNYVLNTEFLIKQLIADAKNLDSQHDFGRNIIPAAIEMNQVMAFRFLSGDGQSAPYWCDVGTLDAFWQANMDLVAITPELNIYDQYWPMWTHQKQSPPGKFIFNDCRRGYVVDSSVSGGCIISGTKISQSLLFSDVHVHSSSHIEQSVILPKVDIAQHVNIKRAIIDTGCQIPEEMSIGINKKHDIARRFRISLDGIVLVTKDMLYKEDNLRGCLDSGMQLRIPA